jgi:DNA-binding IclR family transcriptional regulator
VSRALTEGGASGGQVQRRTPPKSVLERVFALLDCFTAEEPELTLAELTSRTGIPKPTVHRLASVLVERRLLKRTGTGFAVGLGLFELGELAEDLRTLRDASLPSLEDLFEQTHETIHLGVLDGDEVLYFVKIVGYRSFPLPTRTGGRWPVHACALGKVLLAFDSPDRIRSVLQSDLKALTPYTVTDPNRLSLELARAQRDGVAYDREEGVLGNACVAAPIFNSAGHPAAAVSVAGPPVRLRAEQRAPLVRRSAVNITSRIGGRMPGGRRLTRYAWPAVQRLSCLLAYQPRLIVPLTGSRPRVNRVRRIPRRWRCRVQGEPARSGPPTG